MARMRLANGLNVHYERLGVGPDLVMIHGMVGTLAAWHLRIVPMLWDHFQVLTYDLRGHGYTEMTETGYKPTELAGDLKELLDELDISKASIVGHSFGADIALYFAFLFPDRVERVVLIEPLVPAVVPIMTKENFQGPDWVADLLETLGVPIPEDRRLDTDYMIKESAKVKNRWGPTKDMLWRSKKGPDDSVERLFMTTSILKDAIDVGDLTLDAIPSIHTPVHLIFDKGSLIWHKSYEYLLDNLPNVTTSVINTSNRKLSHFALFESPDLVAEQIIEALLPRTSSPAAHSTRGRP